LQVIERTDITGYFHDGIGACGEAADAIVESEEAAQGAGGIGIGEGGGFVGGKVARS
jgi:hypothetical protein